MQDNLVSIISGAGIGAILSAVLVFLNNSKRNTLDYIVKERSEWRGQLKEILEEFEKEEKRFEAVVKLKSRINPYGRNLPNKKEPLYYLQDGHIWDMIESETIDYKILSIYVELLLKYDWDRSKKEIRWSYSSVIFKIINITMLLFIIYSFIALDWYLYLPKDKELLKAIITLVLVVLFPMLVYWSLNQQKYLNDVILANKFSLWNCNVIKLLLPSVLSVIHIAQLGRGLEGIPTIFDINLNFLINRTLFISLPIIIWEFQFIKSYDQYERQYIQNIQEIEKIEFELLN
ncbi:hypothetical protein ACTGW9_04310 [Streptococcus suis]